MAGHSSWVRVPVQGSENVALADMITNELEEVAQKVRYVETNGEGNDRRDVDGGHEWAAQDIQFVLVGHRTTPTCRIRLSLLLIWASVSLVAFSPPRQPSPSTTFSSATQKSSDFANVIGVCALVQLL